MAIIEVLPREILIETIPWFLRSFRDARYGLLAAETLILCEWLNCLHDEISLVLRSPWSSVKMAYLTCRYYPLVYWPIISWAYVKNHQPKLCEKLARPAHGFALPLILAAQAVLLMRAYAFAGRHWAVGALLSTCYAFVVGTHIWFFLINIPTVTVSPEAYPAIDMFGGIGCFVDYRARTLGGRLFLAMLAVVFTDIVSLTIVIICCIRRPSRQTPLGRYFLRQGLGAFTVTSLISGVALGLYFSAHSSYGGSSLPLVFLIPDLVACRLILQLRRRVIPSETQISRQNSRIIRDALSSRTTNRQLATDVWVMEPDY